MKKSIALFIFSAALCASVSAQYNSSISAKSCVDWTTKIFTSQIELDVTDTDMKLPSGRNSAESLIRIKTPGLVKNPLLSLYVDNSSYLADRVLDESISMEEVTKIIENGRQTPALYSSDGNGVNTVKKIDINTISRELIKHKFPYIPDEPIEIVSSRPYTGIIIDARGSIPVHGEYVKSETYPCFFPTIWDEDMNIIYEKNIADREISKQKGLVKYDWQDDFSAYEDRIGLDPLYIRAYKVFGRNRTDPIIRKNDALKILTVKKNRDLLMQGKVVILLDKKNLIYDISVPEKDDHYYASYKNIKRYIYENKVPDIEVSDTLTGILFSVDLKFIPDSPELLPEEAPRIQKIASMLAEIIEKNEFTILVEGHTADLGKPVGQMNLSIERTRTVMNALVSQGIPQSLFTYKGYGATRPIADNSTEAGRAQNRRVDITARPKATYIQRDW
ncbi:MAG: OmpA family protein [Treponema sp.]|nr:OmpA family protein [Treponema sp.]